MSDKMPDAWIVPSASGDGYLCTLSYVTLPGWNRYVPAARIAELEAELAAERERREAAEVILREMAKLYAGQIDNTGNYCNQLHDSARAHFARHEKEPT